MAAPNTPVPPAPALPKPDEVPSLSQSIFHLEKKGLDETSSGLQGLGQATAAH
jgi:hypothetical protein